LQPFGEAPVRVIFSAHSLPARILDMGDPYPQQLLDSSRAVAEAAGVAEWQFAWQSAGRTPEPWLGPDIMDVLRALRQEEHVTNVLICPIGFVSDHLEVLYDVDIECQRLAQELGIRLARTESLNSDPKFIRTLADVVHEAAGRIGDSPASINEV
jgi:ferrochelatase